MKADRAPTVNAPEIRNRVPVMEKSDVETAILSVSTPGVEPGDVDEAPAMARRLSEYTAEVVRAHPGRFGVLCNVHPARRPERPRAQIRRREAS